MRIEKESDALKREYKHLVRVSERLTKKYSYDRIESQLNQIHQRQYQIVKELEKCTGIQITLKTREDILKENDNIQWGEAEDEQKRKDKEERESR
jgi:hypothetical protein